MATKKTGSGYGTGYGTGTGSRAKATPIVITPPRKSPGGGGTGVARRATGRVKK